MQRIFNKIKVHASSSWHRWPLCQFCFCRSFHGWASPRRKSRTQLFNQSI